MINELTVVPIELLKRQIFLIRGQKVMLDADLAAVYGVSTNALNQAVKRNRARVPDDFVFQLSAAEAGALRSQSVTSNVSRCRRSGSRGFKVTICDLKR